jgi:hypothetical protein
VSFACVWQPVMARRPLRDWTGAGECGT